MYLNNKMIYLIVGDAETQLKKTGVVLNTDSLNTPAVK
jgi:hypothetical protein